MRVFKAKQVVVIGGGIVGAAAAFRLAEAGHRVSLLEAENEPAIASSGRSAAGVRVQFSMAENARMSWFGIQEYKSFNARYGLPSGYHPQGYLFLVPEDGWEAHQASVTVQTELGLPVEVLTPKEAQRHVPFYMEGVHACTYGPEDGVVDPKAITRGYLTLAEQHGATVAFNSPVKGVTRIDGIWRVTAGGTAWEADVVVNAAGAASGRVAALAGLKLPVEPSHRSVFVTESLPVSHAYPLTVDVATGTYLRSDGDRLLVGRSNVHEPPGFKPIPGVNWGWLEDTMVPAAKRFPFTAGLQIDRKRSWWGYYALTPDDNAIVGFHPAAEGWLDATGFSGHGIQHAPATGLAVAELVNTGTCATFNLAPYSHTRFHEGSHTVEHHVV